MGSLKLVLCPTKNVPAEHMTTLNKIYQCWHTIWEQASHRLVVKQDDFFSDAFLKSDLTVSLFLDDECIGLSLVRWLSYEEFASRHDSYFKVWKNHIQHFQANPKIAICSHLGADVKYRSIKFDLSLKEIMVHMDLRTFTHSPADIFITTSRCDRSIDKILYSYNTISLEKEAPSPFGDLMALTLSHKEATTKAIQKNSHLFLERLWNNKEVIIPHTANLDFLNTFKNQSIKTQKAG